MIIEYLNDIDKIDNEIDTLRDKIKMMQDMVTEYNSEKNKISNKILLKYLKAYCVYHFDKSDIPESDSIHNMVGFEIRGYITDFFINVSIIYKSGGEVEDWMPSYNIVQLFKKTVEYKEMLRDNKIGLLFDEKLDF